MTAGRRYVVGIATVAAVGVGLSFVLPPATRGAVWFALGLGLAVQGPLGWWVVYTVGTERLVAVWAGGMAARLALLATGGFVVAPRLALPLEQTLLALVGVLTSFVGVEVCVVWLGGRGAGAR